MGKVDGERYGLVGHMMREEPMNLKGGLRVQLRAATVSLSTACPGCERAT